MADHSAIEWTDATWNPTTGCDRTSPGCDHCYAMTLAKRLKAMGSPKYQNDGSPKTSGPGFALTLHPDALLIPYGWNQPRRVFVNSMSDLFHDDVPLSFIREVFAVMADTPQHEYQVLTKRSRRLAKVADELDWPPNVWMGVSIEDDRYVFRANHLRDMCLETETAFFFKQWGGRTPKAGGRLLGGRTWDEMPTRRRAIAYV